MFKFTLPMTIILSSSSCLTLLAIGSLLLINSNTVYTRDINETSQLDNGGDFLVGATIGSPVADQLSIDKTKQINQSGRASSRPRSGRLYNQSIYGASSGSTAGATSQQSLDSYAAAYAAANSPTSLTAADQSPVQQVANDANVYSSFGDVPPLTGSQITQPGQSSSGAGGSSARQIGTGADYVPQSSYYASYMSPSTNEATYSNNGHHHHHHHHQHQQHQQQQYYSQPSHHHYRTHPMGYPTNAGYDRNNYYSDHYASAHYQPAASNPFWSSSSSSGTSAGLMSSASTALSHWTNGFSISEIVCGLIAVAIGAIILGAPFFLIYLALMGNFSGSGSLSLTNPTQATATPGGASTTVNGRRKRLAIFEQSFNMDNDNNKNRTSDYVALADSLVGRLSPFVNFQQLTGTFKQLIDSIEKYSHLKDEANHKNIGGSKKSF